MAYSEVLIFWCLRKGRWKNSCLLGLGQNSELAPVWANPSWSESPKTLPSSSGIPKISPRSIDTPPDIQRQKRHKQTPTDTARCLQTLQDNPQTLLKCMMSDWSHFSKTVKGKNFVHLPFLRHKNIKTSLYAIYKNVWVLTFFLIFMSVREKLQFTVSFDHPVIGNFRIDENYDTFWAFHAIANQWIGHFFLLFSFPRELLAPPVWCCRLLNNFWILSLGGRPSATSFQKSTDANHKTASSYKLSTRRDNRKQLAATIIFSDLNFHLLAS